MIYLICFFVSYVFSQQAELSKKRSQFIFWSLLSIFVTALLAGLRNLSIGNDTISYYNSSWLQAYNTDLSVFKYLSHYSTISRDRFEYAFALLQYIVAKTTGNYNVFLFVVHFIIIGGVYFGAYKMRRHADPKLILLLFYLIYYNHSLNIYRQYIAMAIVFAAYSNIEDGRHLRYLLFVGIGTLFHNTCMIAVLPLLLYRIVFKDQSNKSISRFRRILIWLFIIGVASLFIPFVQFLISRGFLSQKYLYYLNVESASQHTMVLLFLSVELMGLILFWRRFRQSDSYSDFYIYGFFTFLVLYILASTIIYGKRIAAYFSFTNLLTIGMLVKCQNPRNKKIIEATVIIVAFVYWAYVYAYRNASHTIPYKLFS